MSAAQPGEGRADSLRLWSKPTGAKLLIAAPLGLLLIWGLASFHGSVTHLVDSSADGRRDDGYPAFVVTKYPRRMLPPHARLRERLIVAYLNLRDRIIGRKPPTALYVPSSVHAYNVQSLLNECTEMSAKRYLIAREALTVVYFGHTNSLNGTQWVALVERVLQENGILLLSNRTGFVKVIPKTKLDEYRKAKLVKADDHPL